MEEHSRCRGIQSVIRDTIKEGREERVGNGSVLKVSKLREKGR
jgi:hypothetical protein